ncbi:MAG: hypothetical protein QY304_02680 [Candidatus Paceibacterota bacterium]|nr:MAG: hypothetical protein QY304_02680 [Candidatus Paceibacterota bacterium]
MDKIVRDFVSQEPRQYKMKIGRTVASSLTGFVVGAVSASIVWHVALNNFGI